MKLNKTLAAALLLSVTLAGCDSLTGNKNAEENKDTTVTEDTATTEDTAVVDDKATTDEKTADDKAMTDEKETTDADMTADENADDMNDEEVKDTSSMTKEEKMQALEKAIFDNRSMARAGELLLELTPEKVADIQPELESAIDESNALLEKAQDALDRLRAE